MVCDHGGATAPRISALHLLPSSSGTISAPTLSKLSRLNTHPMQLLCTLRGRRHRRNLAQHSLPGGRYPLPGQDFHLLDSASLAWRTPRFCPYYIEHCKLQLSLAGEKSFKALTPERWRNFANRSRLPGGAVVTAVARRQRHCTTSGRFSRSAMWFHPRYSSGSTHISMRWQTVSILRN